MARRSHAKTEKRDHLAKLITPMDLPLFPSPHMGVGDDICEVTGADYETLMEHNIVVPLCTDDPTYQMHVLCQAAAALNVGITTSSSKVKAIAKLYGAHVMRTTSKE